MNFYFFIIVSHLWLATTITAQYHAQYHQGNPASPHLTYSSPEVQNIKSSTPQPLILTHKQTQTHDGGFKYAFSADNGLQQGESIAPDGTRNGLYSYVDPHGQKITIRYTAGKEGFRILDGPFKTPEVPSTSVQQQPYSQTESAQVGPQTFSATGNNYNNRYTLVSPRQPSFISSLPQQPKYQSYKENIEERRESAANNNDIQNEPEYHDEPGKPYSFGNGYSFEFSG